MVREQFKAECLSRSFSTMFTVVVTLGFVLLLPTSMCFGSQVTLEKTVGNKPDVTPICVNETLNIITLILCKITTERNREQECHLVYSYEYKVFNGCDSRFRLVTKNQTVFLHLSSLTPADSGNYTCECSYSGGTDVFHLIVTVEEAVSSSTKKSVLISSIGALILITVTGVLLGFIHQRKSFRSKEAPGLSVHETSGSLDGNDPGDTYMSLQYPADDLYQTVSSVHRQHTQTNNREVHLDNEDLSCEIYENI